MITLFSIFPYKLCLDEVRVAAALDAVLHVAQDLVVAQLAVAAQVVVHGRQDPVAVVLLDHVVQDVGVAGYDFLSSVTLDAHLVLADLVLHDLHLVHRPHLDARALVLLNPAVLQVAPALAQEVHAKLLVVRDLIYT